MALLRRTIRYRMINQRVLGQVIRPEYVVSHVNGSITFVAKAQHGAVTYTPDALEAALREKLAELGYPNMPTLRKGTAQGGRTLYVTFTSRALVVEAEAKYGSTPIRGLIDRLEQELAAAQGATPVGERVVMADLGVTEDFEFPEVELPELEASEV